LRSDVAKRPPSSGTRGRRSGGITGTTVRIIHSGLLPDSRNASMMLRRFASFFFLRSDSVSFASARRSTAVFSRSIAFSISRMASAPIIAVKLSSPYSSCARRYSSSERVWFCLSGVRPGSMTM
jgi:hypothetical protein